MDPFLTPDGNFQVDFNVTEMRMSHSVYNPRLIHRPSGVVLLNRFGTLEDASASVDDEGRLHLDMREYPGSSPGWKLIYDPRDGTITQVDSSGSFTHVHEVLVKYATRPYPPPSASCAQQATRSPAPPASTPPSMQRAAAPATPITPAATSIRTLPRWCAWIYPALFLVAPATFLIVAEILTRFPPFRSLPRPYASAATQFLLGIVLIGSAFAFVMWLHRRSR